MSNLHLFLSFFEFAPLGLFAACLVFDYGKTWNICVKALIAMFLVILNIVQMVLEIRLEYNCWISVMMIFMWGMNLLIYVFQLKKRNFKWK